MQFNTLINKRSCQNNSLLNDYEIGVKKSQRNGFVYIEIRRQCQVSTCSWLLLSVVGLAARRVTLGTRTETQLRKYAFKKGARRAAIYTCRMPI